MSAHDGSRKSVSSDNKEHFAGATPSEDDAPVAHLGVKTAEATHKVYGKYSIWVLFISLGLSAYIYSLDITTTASYLSFAASEFQDHSLIGPIQVAQVTILACGKPVIAKIADVSSRGSAYIFVVFFYVIGYIIIASAKNIQTVAGGIILYAIGNTGLELITQILIADITTLKWRGFVTSMMTLPFVINAFIGSNISAQVLQHSGWRWGYGMFAILFPVSLAPLIATLLWSENKARKLGIVTKSQPGERPPLLRRLLDTANRLDIPGLMLIGASVALILLPLTLSRSAKGGWNNASMIAMLVIGGCLIPVFVFWDFKVAKYPVIAPRFCLNRTVVLASLIGALDFVSFYLTFTYLFSFVVVVKPWSLVNANYFFQTQTVAFAIFSIAGGLAMRFIGRYKHILIIGLVIHLLGIGLMIRSRGANGSDAELVWTQLLQGIGRGFISVSLHVAAQASVPHADVAMAIAVVLLIIAIGGAIGAAIAGSIWANMMPGRLARYLPFVPDAERQTLFGSIVAIRAFPPGDPIREGAIQAYGDVMKVMIIVATAITVVPLLLAFFIPNWHLGDSQNAVENIDLKGERRVGEQAASDLERC